MMEQLGLDWGTEKGFIASMDQTDTLVRGLKTYTDFVTTDKIWDPALGEQRPRRLWQREVRDVPDGRNLVLGRA